MPKICGFIFCLCLFFCISCENNSSLTILEDSNKTNNNDSEKNDSGTAEKSDSGDPADDKDPSDSAGDENLSDSDDEDSSDPTGDADPASNDEDTYQNAGDDDDTSYEIPADTDFKRILVDGKPNKPAFVTVDDLDNDGHLDMIVAQYGPSLSGNYDIYWGTGKLDQWTKETLNIGGNNGISFPHPVKVADVNGDGIKDIVSPSGFLACLVNCGNIFWLEGTGTRNQWTKHEIVKNNDHFFFDVSLVDIDGDGVDDILTNASQKKTISLGNGQDERLMWFKGNDTADRFEKNATVISAVTADHSRDLSTSTVTAEKTLRWHSISIPI